ncbi:ABC transporter permease [Haliangium sp.]|uniref:ABC transporter permease n=1 Tax=Haliangium sp. TaxID=2663208 RepID=UPI003D118C16
MRTISIIFRRELSTYVRSLLGWVTAALVLLVDGVLFQTFALGSRARLSADVLQQFFLLTGILVQVAGILLSGRLLTDERQQHTIVLLNTSPVRDVEIVLGKYLAALVFLTGMIATSVYMPLLIMVNGKVAASQLLVGYLGLLLLGASSLAIGTFASSLVRSQFAALMVGAVINVLLVLFFPMARRLDAPLQHVFEQLDLWWLHFQDGFMKGVFNLVDVVYYLAMIYFFLLLATKTLEAKRWQ